METYGRWNNRRAATLTLLVILFVSLLVIPLLLTVKNVMAFEDRAQTVIDAAKAAELFKRDYLMALYAPVNQISVCSKIPKMDPCNVYLRAPQVSNIVGAPGKYAPMLSIAVEDPPWNATTYLDLMVFGKYGITPSLDVIEPAINSTHCWAETIDSVNYRYCSLECNALVRITKVRHYAAGVGNSGGAIIDNISVDAVDGAC